ncbi:Cysteine synthase [hydrothermal vent metagenome]|uniref:cysteine synthase n=1 Tax=hydrothermal vent metagenome TaxID=652676 RepID=A0A3B0RKX5_9ZZZZ
MTEQTIGHGHIFADLAETMGNTPLVRLSRFSAAHDIDAEILAKCEFFNPLASVKDRIGVAMINDLEAQGVLQPGGTIVEPTSGNTGIALAFVAAARGYRLILTMPASMSVERRKMLSHLGAEIELTDPSKGMKGAINRADELVKTIPGAILARQFSNPANPAIHAATTAEEIWRDTDGKLDAFVAGVGTGGTLTGVARVLKPRLPKLQIVAVEPAESPVIAGGEAGPHKIQGIGAGFIPDNLDVGLIDSIIAINTPLSIKTAQEVAKIEGLPCGISSGAALAAALQYGKANPGSRIVVILPSFAERYLSTSLFEPE